MKVYTHFYLMDENTAIGFRWRTLLQYGNSWEVIGSVVMKNPGGAKFKSPTHQAIDDAETLRQLRHFDESKDKWYEFGSDTTIDCVGDLFAFYYDLPRREDLNGVIQIFNLFYIKEADLSKALVYSEATSNTFRFADEENVTNYDIEHLVPPVYLGFGNLAWHKRYNQKAEQFFNAAINKCGMKYLDPIFQHNFVPPHNMPNWKIQLIKDPALLDKNTSHYIAIPEDNSYCYLLKSKRPRDIDGSIKINRIGKPGLSKKTILVKFSSSKIGEQTHLDQYT